MCLSSQNPGIPFNKFYCSITKYETNYKLGSALQTDPGFVFISNLRIEYKYLLHALPFGFSSRHTDWFDK